MVSFIVAEIVININIDVTSTLVFRTIMAIEQSIEGWEEVTRTSED